MFLFDDHSCISNLCMFGLRYSFDSLSMLELERFKTVVDLLVLEGLSKTDFIILLQIHLTSVNDGSEETSNIKLVFSFIITFPVQNRLNYCKG